MPFQSPGTDNATLREILAQLRAQGLEADQERLLAKMVEAERRVPAEQSHPFTLVFTLDGGYSLVHLGLQDDAAVAPGDVRSLAEAGLLRPDFASTSSETYEVTNRGRAYYKAIKARDGEPIERVEAEIRYLLDDADFQGRHSAAHSRWSEAEAAVWDAKTTGELTNIGHACREALQLFVTDLVERHQPVAVEPDPQKTVARLRAVLGTVDLPDAVGAFLEALLNYFGTVSDLVQRQEHGAQKEGQLLVWEDARRVVFQTASVMFELDHALG